MSVSILEATKDHLNSEDTLDGYRVLFFRWHDDDLERDNEPFVMLRSSGGGLTDPVGGVGFPDLQIYVVGTVSSEIETNRKAFEIRDFLIDNHRAGNIVNYQSLSDVIGPLRLNNNRPIYEINLRLTTSRAAS